MWLLARHGTKYPSGDIINGINTQLIEDIQKNLISLYKSSPFLNLMKSNQKKVISGIIEWKNIFASASDKDLNERGKHAMMELGERLNHKFKTLLTKVKKDEFEASIFLSRKSTLFIYI